MGHFAKINDSNEVESVTTIDDNDIRKNGGEYTSEVETFVSNMLGGNWKQCSYTGRHRKNYPGKGWTWDASKDGFVEPKGDWRDAWTLNETTLRWEPPHPSPNDTQCLTGVTWTPLEEEDKKDSEGNDVVIKQFHHVDWSNTNDRWESVTYNQDGSKDKEWYWDNSNSQFVEK
jgi:hypothetical protein